MELYSDTNNYSYTTATPLDSYNFRYLLLSFIYRWITIQFNFTRVSITINLIIQSDVATPIHAIHSQP